MADLSAKVSCTYCQEEINEIRVQCCVCPEFDICLQCFSNGAEIGPHKNDHSYKFVDNCVASIFGGRGNWTGEEELQLLDGVELYGFGNWKLVSDHVKTKTPEEAKEEYVARFLDGNIGRATWAEYEKNRPVLHDHVPDDNGPLSSAAMAKMPPLDITPDEARLLGYKPFRDDYEKEYFKEAEQIIAKLQLDTAEDTEMEVALKLAMVDMYTRRLRERARRKRIVRDYQLVSTFFASSREESSKRHLTKEQKEFREKMAIFAQSLNAAEHERLIASIERERELRHRLSELLRYRSLGLSTQDEIIHYEQHAAFQRQQQLKQKSGSSGCAMPESPTKNGRGETDPNSTEGRCTSLTEGQQENDSNTSNAYLSDSSSDSVSPSIKSLPLGWLLSKNEVQFCTKLNLQPVHYVTLKSLIIQENLMSPMKVKLPEAGSDELLSVKDAVTQYIYHSGWLPGVSVL